MKTADKAICPVCGAEFAKEYPSQKHCSMACYHKRNMKACLFCGKKFGQTRPGQWYCSVECREAANRKRRQEKPVMQEKEAKPLLTVRTEESKAVCAFCGKQFEKRRSRRIYCSAKCQERAGHRRLEAKRKLARETLRRERACPVCGTMFMGKESKIYCSVKCRNKGLQNSHAARGEAFWGKNEGQGRVWHDCGKPTPDYRCPECLKKWRLALGVAYWDNREDGIF